MRRLNFFRDLLYHRCEEVALRAVRTRPVPQHVSIVIDGNRRFAREQGIPIAEGHRIGYDNVEKTINTFSRLGVPCITVWMFSINNFGREPQQVKDIMNIINDLMTRWISPGGMARERNLQVRIHGKTSLLDPDILETFRTVMAATKGNDEGAVNLLIPYTGTDEMVQAINAVIQTPSLGPSTQEMEAMIAQQIDRKLFTGGDPPLDILIRTGASRLSDFMNWQCNEKTEIAFCDCLWPEFSTWWILQTVLRWQDRESREGRVAAQDG